MSALRVSHRKVIVFWVCAITSSKLDTACNGYNSRRESLITIATIAGAFQFFVAIRCTVNVRSAVLTFISQNTTLRFLASVSLHYTDHHYLYLSSFSHFPSPNRILFPLSSLRPPKVSVVLTFHQNTSSEILVIRWWRKNKKNRHKIHRSSFPLRRRPSMLRSNLINTFSTSRPTQHHKPP